MRPAHAVVGAGLVPAGLAAAFAAPPGGRVPHAHELRLQLQPARANGRPAVPGATAPAAPVADRHHRQHARRPIPAEAADAAAAVPTAPVRPAADVRPPAAAVRVADDDQLPGVAGVVVAVLRVARHQPVHVRRQRDLLQRRHHQTAVGRPSGDRGGGQDGRGAAAAAAGARDTGAVAAAAR